MIPGWLRLAPAALAVAAGACTARDTVAISEVVGDDRGSYCAGEGSPVLADGTCTGRLAERLFRHAVCGCDSLTFDGDFETDAFDSRNPPYVPGEQGGHVASNAGFYGNEVMTIRGDVSVGGAEGVEAGTVLTVTGNLNMEGSLGRPTTTITVDGVAHVAGDVRVNSLNVKGTLITGPGAMLSGEVMANTMETAEVSVPQPCRCDDAVDVAVHIGNHEVANHNGEYGEDGLDPAALTLVEGDAELDLPCGRYYLDELSGTGAGTVAIRATGRTALFVGGNITLQQDLVVALESDAELDLFVGGNIQVSGVTRLGEPDRPRALRVYVVSGGSIRLTAGSELAGNLYAPLTDLASSVPLDLFGALVVNRVIAEGGATVKVHHDRAIADAAETCAN